MDWTDESTPEETPLELPRIKPRRIDAPHSATPAPELGNQTAITTPVGHEAAAIPSEEVPVFHEVPTGISAWEVPAVSPFPESEPEQDADDLSLQAEQLAGELQAQLRDLDEREAALERKAAELAEEWHSCQKWHVERLAELQEREAALAARDAEMLVFTQRQNELSERLRDCEAQELALDQREFRLNEREASLVAAEHEFRDRRHAAEREAAALSRSQQIWEQTKSREEQAFQRQRQQHDDSIEARRAEQQREMQEQQQQIAEALRQLEQERQAVREERDAWDEQCRQEADRNLRERRRTEEEIERRLSSVAARESAADAQQASLEQLRSEMTSAYRQALEMRLVAEQVWAQLKGLMTPAEITQSLAQLRLKMAEQYEQEERSLAERKEELLALADKLAQQHANLKAQRMEFSAWRKNQQEEIARQAEHLCRRVQELSEEHKRLREQGNRHSKAA